MQTWSAPASRWASHAGCGSPPRRPRRRSRPGADRCRRRRGRPPRSRAGACCSGSSAPSCRRRRARGRAPRARLASSVRITACSGASSFPAPSRSRACAVCSTGTKYGCAPSVRSRARSSIFGPSAASTTGTRSAARGHVGRRLHRVEVCAHGRERRAVRLAAQLDRVPVAAAEAEQEAARERLAERVGAGPRRRGIARVDVRDPGGDDEVARPGEGERGGGEVLPRERLADPDRGVAEPLDLGQRLAELLGGPVRHARAPDADPAEPLEGAAHAATVLGGAPPSRLGARWR